MAAHGTKAIVAALIANGLISVAKFVGFVVTGSASLLAEGVHSVADTSNQGLLLLGGHRARRKPTPSHPFGYARERYFWSFVVAVVLFTLGSAFALYEGVEKIRHPHELESLEWAIGILVFGIVAEGISFRTAIVEAEAIRGDSSWWRFIRTSKNPEIPVVLLEDLGAMLGLVIALGAVVTSQVTGDPTWDGYGTLAIGVLLGLIAITLAIEMKSLLIGESATPDVESDIREVIESDADTVAVLGLKTQHLGPQELLVATRVQFSRALDVEGVCVAIDRVERHIREQVPAAAALFIEPDIDLGAGDDGTR